jgi:replicative DNA helicase
MSAIESKGLPCNLDAERAVLGSILMDDSQFVQVAGLLESRDFMLQKHRRIFNRMVERRERGERAFLNPYTLPGASGRSKQQEI